MEAFDRKLAASIVALEKKNKSTDKKLSKTDRRVDKVISTQSRINDTHLKLLGELIKKIQK
jgi:hypothetical protein